MNKLLSAEGLANLIATARESKKVSQKSLAKSMHKSIGTIQNWEYGVSTPNILELLELFDVLGISPLPYLLKYLYPNNYSITPDSDISQIKATLNHWINEIVTDRDLQMLSYCVYGRTGSSCPNQINMFCALNHLPIMDRINIAENIYNLYLLEEARENLRGMEYIPADMKALKNAIEQCKNAVFNGKDDYTV